MDFITGHSKMALEETELFCVFVMNKIGKMEDLSNYSN